MLNLNPGLLSALLPLGLAFSAGHSVVESAAPAAEPEHVDLERAYPNLRFDRPIFLTSAEDGTGRLFVVEQGGVIRVFDGAEEDARGASVFLDLSDAVSRRGNEEGLLGLAFHPDFGETGEFFVYFSSARDAEDGGVAPSVVARFTAEGDVADPDSEELVIELAQPYRNHNGGMIAFGPDGYLYISYGDGGAADDPHGNGQNLGTLLGSIVRIDVDAGDGERGYGIPEDNPFLGVEGARPELWAIGLRNVWRFSFDRDEGTLIAGEVGQNRIEEVDVIVGGGNYGWNTYEASEDFKDGGDMATEPHIAPVAEYTHDLGISITGGYTYRGSAQPALVGSYFFGDYVSGNLWRMRANGDDYDTELARRTGRSIASFGEDEDGELFIVSFDGGLYRVVASDEPEATYDDWPTLLSETGYYESTRRKKVAAGALPYFVNAPFWSDGAGKERFVILPEGDALGYSDEGAWEVPVGTVILKEFEGEHGGRAKRLETRVIRKTEDAWEAATYVWGRGDAELLPSGKQFELWSRRTGVTSWHAPSASECASCHTDASGFVLGLRTAQLNREVDGENQIAAWIEAGKVVGADAFEPAAAASFPDPHDGNADLGARARAYLDVNCAMCHRPDGPGNAAIDLRHGVELGETGLIGVEPSQGTQGLKGGLLVSPGHPEASVLLQRVETLGAGRMPPIGSNRVDEAAVALLREWIEEMD